MHCCMMKTNEDSTFKRRCIQIYGSIFLIMQKKFMSTASWVTHIQNSNTYIIKSFQGSYRPREQKLVGEMLLNTWKSTGLQISVR